MLVCAQGTIAEKIKMQLESHEQMFKLMIQERFDELEKQSGDELIHCEKCKSSNVIFDLRQTRSADEGMTAILNCLKCSYSWKM